MLTIDKTEVNGFEAALRGMRNPLNSWDKADSSFECVIPDYAKDTAVTVPCVDIGNNDLSLCKRLAANGAVHAKYRRMITVTCDIVAPLYWWKEFDTYKVGTVANSCSTMHKIQAKKFMLDDFSHEHLDKMATDTLMRVVWNLNTDRAILLKTGNKDNWWNLIQLLPSSYNQKRTVLMNYEMLTNVLTWRQNHKLDEWHTFCDWAKSLPYAKDLMLNGGEQP